MDANGNLGNARSLKFVVLQGDGASRYLRLERRRSNAPSVERTHSTHCRLERHRVRRQLPRPPTALRGAGC